MLLRWFPPSWCQLRFGERIVYVDPAFLRTYYRNHPFKIEFSRWPDPIDGLPEDLPKADLILLTHDHQDHAKAVTINRLRRADTRVAGPRSCAGKLGEVVHVIGPGETLEFNGLEVKAVAAYNTPQGSSTRKVHRRGHGVGYLISGAGRSIYHAGDTDLIPEMEEVKGVDVALLPIGGTYTMDLEEALRAARVIAPRTVIPIHHLRADPQEFKARLEAGSGIRVRVLGIGEVHRVG